jgi:hypothetical protein
LREAIGPKTPIAEMVGALGDGRNGNPRLLTKREEPGIEGIKTLPLLTVLQNLKRPDPLYQGCQFVDYSD